MLIDSYERPYSPEATKSRAFIDRILALSGPDGGVLGTGDDVPTQRPLRDEGREAWDMIHSLRRNAWEKADLDPRLRTGQDQEQNAAGIALTSGPNPLSSGRAFWATSAPALPATSTTAAFFPVPQPQPTDFNRPSRPQMSLTTTDFDSVPPAPIGSVTGPSEQELRSETVHDMDSAYMNPPQPVSGRAPLAMVDPNIDFDWDQWDAVFGQSLPVADDLMDIDPATVSAFADMGDSVPGRNNID